MDSYPKIKVVWLCHFSNLKVQSFLRPKKNVSEIAPWISSLINLFEGSKLVEVHIISPHRYIRQSSHFVINGIYYHFFNPHIPVWGRHWPGVLKVDYWTDFFFTKLIVKNLINKISPNLIHLHGPENAYYSSSIVQFKDKLPCLITIQGFISREGIKRNYQINKCIRHEKKILGSFKHFGYRTLTMGKEIRKFNPSSVLHWHHYPVTEIGQYNAEKKYDIVFFAKITKEKGIEDLLEAVHIIKGHKPDVSLCVIGKTDETYLTFLQKKAIELGIEKNIIWIGFLPQQKDVHEYASLARISVLPTYNEIISGTIIESMFLRLPVVAYNTGSIFEINEEEKIISLVEVGDIKKLAKEIENLLSDVDCRNRKAESGYQRAKKMFDNSKIFEDLHKTYREVIHDFKKK